MQTTPAIQGINVDQQGTPTSQRALITDPVERRLSRISDVSSEPLRTMIPPCSTPPTTWWPWCHGLEHLDRLWRFHNFSLWFIDHSWRFTLSISINAYPSNNSKLGTTGNPVLPNHCHVSSQPTAQGLTELELDCCGKKCARLKWHQVEILRNIFKNNIYSKYNSW